MVDFSQYTKEELIKMLEGAYKELDRDEYTIESQKAEIYEYAERVEADAEYISYLEDTLEDFKGAFDNFNYELMKKDKYIAKLENDVEMFSCLAEARKEKLDVLEQENKTLIYNYLHRDENGFDLWWKEQGVQTRKEQ